MSKEKNEVAPTLRVAGMINDSITDGPGLRFTLFLQGCRLNCPGCHNPDSIPDEGGESYTVDQIIEKINKNPLLSGVTFSGGEPFLQAKALLPLARLIKEVGLDLAIYSGYTFETIIDGTCDLFDEVDKEDVLSLLSLTDTLVDGPFILAEKSLTIPFRGSKNQRLLNVQKSLEKQEAIAQEDPGWVLA